MFIKKSLWYIVFATIQNDNMNYISSVVSNLICNREAI